MKRAARKGRERAQRRKRLEFRARVMRRATQRFVLVVDGTRQTGRAALEALKGMARAMAEFVVDQQRVRNLVEECILGAELSPPPRGIFGVDTAYALNVKAERANLDTSPS